MRSLCYTQAEQKQNERLTARIAVLEKQLKEIQNADATAKQAIARVEAVETLTRTNVKAIEEKLANCSLRPAPPAPLRLPRPPAAHPYTSMRILPVFISHRVCMAVLYRKPATHGSALTRCGRGEVQSTVEAALRSAFKRLSGLPR